MAHVCSIQQKTKYEQLPDDAENGEKTTDTLFLFSTVFTVTLILFAGGSAFAWTSPVISQLLSNNTDINPIGQPITGVQVSILTGLPSITGVFGGLAGPSISDVIGRKTSLQIVGVIMMISNIGIAFSKEISLLIVTKCIFLPFYAAAIGISALYTTEICEDHNRGKYGCLPAIIVPLGSLFAYIVGPMFNITMFTLITTIPLVIFLMFSIFIPESPAYLLSKKREDKCREVLQLLRSNKTSTEIKLDIDSLKQTLVIKKSRKYLQCFAIFQTKECRIGLLVGLVPIFLQVASGEPIFIALLAPVLDQAGTTLSGNSIAIIVGASKVLTTGVVTFLMEKIGRRSLLLLSCTGCFLTMFMFGMFFHLKQLNPYTSFSNQWIPITSIIVYIIMFSVGIGPIPHVLVGELFTYDLRSTAVSISLSVIGIFGSVCFFIFPLAAANLGLQWCMWFFSINCALGAIFIYFMLPETSCKSINEIQLLLKNSKNTSSVKK